MAFTGTAVFETVADGVVRVTGLSLASSQNGTIGLFGGAAEVPLPDNFNPTQYGTVDLAESLQFNITSAVAGAAALFLTIAKTTSPFLATITNNDGVNATGNLEIYVRYH